MFLLTSLILGAIGLWLSHLFYRSLLSPLGLYCLAWSVLVTLHHIVSASNPGLYYELDSQTKLIVVLAWIAWIVGCLIGKIGPMRQGNTDTCERWINVPRLRLLLIALSLASGVCVAASILKLSAAGVLFQPGDAWREAHNISTADLFTRGLIYNLAIMFSHGAVFAGTSLGIYAVMRHRLSVWFAIMPAFFGVVYDLSIAGRFWIMQAPVLVIVAYLLATKLSHARNSGIRANAMDRQTSQGIARPHDRKFWSGTRMIVAVTAITLAGLFAISQLRVGVKRLNEQGLKIADVEMTNVMVGPILYATDTMGLLNAYCSSQRNWGTTNGKLFLGGIFYLANIPSMRLFRLDVGGEVWSYVVESDDLVPIGYQRNGQFFTTYILPANVDFGFLGVFIYPLVAGFFFSKIYQRAVVGLSLLSMGLYPLVAVWVVFTVMRWELVGPTPWIALGYLFIADIWVVQRRSK